MSSKAFREIVVVDFEYQQRDGEPPQPRCVVARELGSGRLTRVWLEGRTCPEPPYQLGDDDLFVAFFASAELGCHLALGWPMPRRVLDLYVEFKNMTNGRVVQCGHGLLGALAHFGIDAMDAAEKKGMRELAMSDGPFSEEQRRALTDYCQVDVDMTSKLLHAMAPHLDMSRALIRGRYMCAVAMMEHTGVPIDVDILKILCSRWSDIRTRLVQEIDASYGVYDGTTFKMARWLRWLSNNGIPWPMLESGRPQLCDDTFRQMSNLYPAVAPIRELRHALSQMRLANLAVGADGRNRTLLSPFRSITSRNQPSNTRFIFGPSVWLRGLIKPKLGTAISYVDWEQQEFGIAAALSGDPAMIAAYRSGDPYLEFAKQAEAVPETATRQSHPHEREIFKQCALGVQYGMGPQTLAVRIGRSIAHAEELLRLVQKTYPVFWKWSSDAVDYGMQHLNLHTVFGWRVHVTQATKPRTLMNFPMQANGAEMLRLACCEATEQGIRVCAPVHDALLIEAPIDEIEDAVSLCRQSMARASGIVLGGFELRTDSHTVHAPDHYMDKRGEHMWRLVMQLLKEPTQEGQTDSAAVLP